MIKISKEDLKSRHFWKKHVRDYFIVDGAGDIFQVIKIIEVGKESFTCAICNPEQKEFNEIMKTGVFFKGKDDVTFLSASSYRGDTYLLDDPMEAIKYKIFKGL